MKLIDADTLKISLAYAEQIANWPVPMLRTVFQIIDETPVIKTEHKKGKWKLNWKNGSAKCSECGYVQSNAFDLDNWDNFCHHCGADMRGDTNENM